VSHVTPNSPRPVVCAQTNGKMERFHRTMTDGWAFTVPAPPVNTPTPTPTNPAPTGPLPTTASVTTAKKSTVKKKSTFAITVTAADGSAASGTVFLIIAGPQKVAQKLTFTSGRAVTKVVFKKAGRYTATAKVTKGATLDSSKSTLVRFKVVAPNR
jgi:hypothetical protein